MKLGDTVDSYDELVSAADELGEAYGREACFSLVTSKEFQEGSGSSSPSSHQHHVGRGGLVVHTAEVLRYALGIAATMNADFTGIGWKEVDVDILTVAVIFHDCMKTREYEEFPSTPIDGIETVWKKTPYNKLIRHVCGSFAEWVAVAKTYGYEQSFVDAVGHCILAHHGQIAWGSPVEPQTVEALILHQADMLSALYGRNKDS